MTQPWKTLLLCVALYQLVLTFALWRMSDYLQWLHFNTTAINYRGLMDTAPGRMVGLLLLVVGGIFVLVNLVAFARHAGNTTGEGPAASDTSESS